MKITEVYYERTFNLGNYESMKVGLRAGVDKTEDPQMALEDLALQAKRFKAARGTQT